MTIPPFVVAAGSARTVDHASAVCRQWADLSACKCFGAGRTVRYALGFLDAGGAPPEAL
jgi:hypothetical protein